MIWQCSNILPLIVNILEVLNIEKKPLTETSNLLVTFNSSVNVFIYIIFGEKFQKQFIQWIRSFWCCRKWCGRLPSNGTLTASANPLQALQHFFRVSILKLDRRVPGQLIWGIWVNTLN